MSDDAQLERIGDHWSKQVKINQAGGAARKWWANKTIQRHINTLVCGRAIDGLSAGFHSKLAEFRDDAQPFRRGVSIGCGKGVKEMALIGAGIVDHMTLFELSEVRVKQGQEIAVKRGLVNNVTFVLGDGMAPDAHHVDMYDLVYWNNALHHMMDTPLAVAWSYDMLSDGGLFAMDDYVGPNQFQWSEQAIQIAQEVRNRMPDRIFIDKLSPGGRVNRVLRRQNPEKMREVDPSEAADSSRIVPAINTTFANAEIIYTGGVIYQTGLAGLLQNFSRENSDDNALLEIALFFDQYVSGLGHSNYAVAFARKRN